jgi:hypothetical protein
MEERQRKKSSDDLIARGRPRSSDSCESEASSAASGVDIELYTRFNVTPNDLIPTRRPRRHSEDAGNSNLPNFAMTSLPTETAQSGTTTPEPEFELGCEHYKRNVKIQCFECKLWWNCRYCHDQAELGHTLPRHKTENMLCMLCQTPGPAGQYCEHCGEQSAYYFCEICKLWDDDSTKRIYHCADCGICRLGEGLGKDFQHCKVSCDYSPCVTMILIFCSAAMCVYHSSNSAGTNAWNEQRTVTVQFVVTICSVPRLQSSPCHAVITCIELATISIC